MKSDEKFWFKNPKDMTPEEIEALPTGPVARCAREWTVQERVAGVTEGRQVYWLIRLEEAAVSYDDNDIISFVDKEGNKYRFGKYKNGAWFKEPVFL